MAITTIIKRLLGVEDVNWDTDGSDSRFPVETSTGGTRSVKRVNSSDLPSTTATREKKRIGSTTPTTGGKDVDGHLQEIYDDLNKIGEPDDATVVVTGGQLKVGAIAAGNIGTKAVETLKINDGAVTALQLGTGAVTTAKLDTTADTQAVTTATIRNLAVNGDKIAASAVDTAELANYAVTPIKMDMDGANSTFSHYLKAAGIFEYGGGASSVGTTVAGVHEDDLICATILASTNVVSLWKVVPSENTLTFYWAGHSSGTAFVATDPGAGTKVFYFVWKPVV